MREYPSERDTSEPGEPDEASPHNWERTEPSDSTEIELSDRLRDEAVDPRAAAMDGYHLDPASQAAAQECGRRLGERMSEASWADASSEERAQLTNELHRDIIENLGTSTGEPTFDPATEHYGYYFDGSVHLREDFLMDEDPRDLVETLAHEDRHAWQEAVIKGELQHPLGEEARQKLEDADKAYAADQNDFESYVLNEMERDAEAFGWSVYAEYAKRQKDGK